MRGAGVLESLGSDLSVFAREALTSLFTFMDQRKRDKEQERANELNKMKQEDTQE